MQNTKLPKVPDSVNAPFRDICNIMAALCKERLNEEYFNLSVELAAKIARKRPSPFLSGHTKTWAAGIIHALGLVNFLFDKTQSPHLTSKELCAWFDLGQNTISAKSKFIRDMFKMYQMDTNWCLPSKVINNPFSWMVSFDGYIVDIRRAPYEMQVEALKAGVIPFIPNKLNPHE
jgi:Domain of unknown function (DUF6398)